MSTRIRPIQMISRELDAAREMSAAAVGVDRSDPFVRSMLEANEAEVSRLESELEQARSSDIELSVDGRRVVDHRIDASYLARVISDLQAAYRAIAEMTDTSKLSRAATALTVAGTEPGSFRVRFRTAEEPLSLIDPPLSSRAIEGLLSVLDAQASEEATREWTKTASEASVRSMIRLAATLAASGGTSQFRWTPPGSPDRVLALSSAQARSIAVNLAGATGSEVVNVSGRLHMAQDDPPKIRIGTEADDYVYVVDVRDDDLLQSVERLLFKNVSAEILVQMTTSPSTGAPRSRSELLDLRPAEEDRPSQTMV